MEGTTVTPGSLRVFIISMLFANAIRSLHDLYEVSGEAWIAATREWVTTHLHSRRLEQVVENLPPWILKMMLVLEKAFSYYQTLALLIYHADYTPIFTCLSYLLLGLVISVILFARPRFWFIFSVRFLLRFFLEFGVSINLDQWGNWNEQAMVARRRTGHERRIWIWKCLRGIVAAVKKHNEF